MMPATVPRMSSSSFPPNMRETSANLSLRPGTLLAYISGVTAANPLP